ncbi:hypothetical protein X728_04060 [Mesorhizobium sp. L103C120A0]|nr:hypothetical protein X728_04060 [Mesorhizobium sp. L103C120A0]
MPSTADSRLTGRQPGALTAVAPPATADEAAALAERLVGDLLPLSVRSWLTDTEMWSLRVHCAGERQPVRPELTTDDRATLTAVLQSLSEVLTPSVHRGT